MTDRSTGRVSNDPDAEEQSGGSRYSTPPHPPHAGDPDNFEEMHSHHHDHTSPHSDPHRLQLQQGDLRHRFEARGSPTASSNLTGAAATSDHRHQNQTSDHFGAAITSQPRESWQPPETQPFPSEEAPPSVSPPRPANSNTTISTDPHLAPFSSTTIPPGETTAISTNSSISSSQTPTPRVIDRDHIRSLASGEPSPVSSGTATPTGQHRRRFRSIRPIVYAIMALEKGRKFSTGTSVHRKRQMSTLVETEGHYGPALTVC